MYNFMNSEDNTLDNQYLRQHMPEVYDMHQNTNFFLEIPATTHVNSPAKQQFNHIHAKDLHNPATVP